jgi:serine O-acetyltransferase
MRQAMDVDTGVVLTESIRGGARYGAYLAYESIRNVPQAAVTKSGSLMMSNDRQKYTLIRVGKIGFAALSTIRLLPHIALLLLSPNRENLWRDLDRYAVFYESGMPESRFDRVILFIWVMTFLPEYRSVFYFRHRTLGHLLGLLCPPMKSLGLLTKKTCGPGILVHHGFGTSVTAEEIGANFTIRNLATVGYGINSIDTPKIGSNVTIGIGARVLGGVTIGDDVVVGPNSLVISDVPAGATVIGVPSKIVSRRPAVKKELARDELDPFNVEG